MQTLHNVCMKIIAIAGSLRAGSYNLRLARTLEALAPDTIEVATIYGIPLYDADLEDGGLPQLVTELKDKIAAAAGVLIVSPEYNGSLPGVTKNAVDWLSRPVSDIPHVFGGKAAGIVGATPGPAGTRLAQTAWLPVLRTLTTVPYFERALYVDNAAKLWSETGEVLDPKFHERAKKYVEGFVAFARSCSRSRA
jgi:NAD(P)H-dependent FMN reductase